MASKKKNNPFAAFLIGPIFVCVGVLALWENEGRFNFYKAAKNATVAPAGDAPVGEPFATTDALDTQIPIAGHYVEQFVGFHRVNRHATIWSWEKDEDSDGNTTWDLGWHSSVESNSRNSGIRQTLRSDTLYPPKYQLGELEIDPADIHLVDSSETIRAGSLKMVDAGRQQNLRVAGEYFFKGRGSINSPKEGDERLGYTGIPNAATASYFGMIEGDRARGKKYDIRQSFLSGIIQNDGVLHHLVNGDRDTALASVKSYFSKVMWFTRLGGTAAVVIGVMIFIGGFASLLYRIPILGRVVGWAVFGVSLVVGLTLSLLVMITSALVHHPIAQALPVAVVIAGIVWLVRSRRKAKQNVQTALTHYQQAHASDVDDGFDLDGPGMSTGLAEKTFGNLAKLALEGGLSKQENRFLVKWAEKNGIDAERMKQLYDEAKQDSTPARAADRNDFVLLVCLAMADGTLSAREQSVLKRMAKHLGLSTDEVRKIVIGVETGVLEPV
ncbi:TMEM43 family protein [Aeoliella sp.]|uniref:TMEM43 family protein n=1 Tax=Aeoliella sp. TaxID=2795800 RepID=UPI003CCBEC0F